MIQEMYSQMFRNVCIFFIYMCMCVYSYREEREAGTEGDRNRHKETGERLQMGQNVNR